MATKLWALGALDLAGRIAAKEISSREVIGAHLARIEAVNPPVNTVTVALADQAMAAAATADQAIAVGRSLGPLHGVPFTVKENLDVEGGATTAYWLPSGTTSPRPMQSWSPVCALPGPSL
jgi:amidase